MFLPVFSFWQFFDALYTRIGVAMMYVFPYRKRLKYSRLAVWYHFSDFDEPHSSLK